MNPTPEAVTPLPDPALPPDEAIPVLSDIVTLTPDLIVNKTARPLSESGLVQLRQTVLNQLLDQLQPLIDTELSQRLAPTLDKLLMELRPALNVALKQLIEDAVWQALSTVLDAPDDSAAGKSASGVLNGSNISNVS